MWPIKSLADRQLQLPSQLGDTWPLLPLIPHLFMPQVPLHSQDVALGQEHIPRRASEDPLHEEAFVLSKVHQARNVKGMCFTECWTKSCFLLTTSKVVQFFWLKFYKLLKAAAKSTRAQPFLLRQKNNRDCKQFLKWRIEIHILYITWYLRYSVEFDDTPKPAPETKSYLDNNSKAIQ